MLKNNTNNKFAILIQKVDLYNRFSVLQNVHDITDLFPEGKKRKSTEYIIIHHDAIYERDYTPVFEINDYHISKHWRSIGYTFYITDKAKVYKLHSVRNRTVHTKGLNNKSVSVCLKGNFDKTKPSKKQYKRLIKLLKYLKEIFPMAKITGHREHNQTSCPGKNLDVVRIRTDVKQYHFLN